MLSGDAKARADDIERLAKELAIAIRSTARPEDEKAADMVLVLARECARGNA